MKIFDYVNKSNLNTKGKKRRILFPAEIEKDVTADQIYKEITLEMMIKNSLSDAKGE